jgi:hypothetical protein
MNDPTKWQPTARLRFVVRTVDITADMPPNFMKATRDMRILQQWYAPDMPGYMRDPTVGEWRDVPIGIETP